MANDVQILVSAQDKATDALSRVSKSLQDLAAKVTGMSGSNNRLADSFEKSNSAALNFSGTLAKFGVNAIYFTAMGAAINGVTQAMTAGATALIGYNAKMEQTQMGLTTMIGDADAAKLFIDQMKDFAAVTPFQFEDVDKAAKRFMAFGWQVKNIIPDLTAVGNAASALGIGSEGIDRITLALGQMSIKARLSGEEVRQLNEAGISAQDYLVKAFDLTADAFNDLSKTGITGTQAVRAIIEGMANDQKFAGMMEKQSKTLIGQWSTLKDNSREIFGKIGETMSANITKSIAAITDKTQDFVKDMREGGINTALEHAFGPDTAKLIEKTGNVLSAFADTAVSVGRAVAGVAGPIAGAFLDIAESITLNALTAIKSFADYCTANLPLVQSAVEGIAVGFAVWKSEAILGAIISVTKAVEEMIIVTQLLATEGIAGAGVLATMGGAGGALAGIIAFMTNPITLAALAIGGLTAAAVYFNSKQDEAATAATTYANGFNMIGYAAGYATGEINAYNQAHAEYLRMQGEKAGKDLVGNDYDEKGSGRIRDITRYRAQSILDNAGGRPPMDPGTTKDKGEGKYENAVQRMAELLASLDEKIMDAVGTTPAAAIAKLNKEIVKAQNDIDDAAAVGVDTSEVTAKLTEYSRVAREKINADLLTAQKQFAAETLTLAAKTSDDKMVIADTEYNQTLVKLEKEKQDWEKSGMTKEEVEKRYTEAVKAAAKTRDDARREENLADLNRIIQYNNMRTILEGKTQAQVDVLNKTDLQNKLGYLNKELDNAALSKEKRLQLEKEKYDTLTQLEEINGRDITQSVKVALDQRAREFVQWSDEVKGAMSDVEESFISNNAKILSGQQSFADAYKNIWTDMINDICQLIIKKWYEQTIKKYMDQMVGDVVNWLWGSSSSSSSSSGSSDISITTPITSLFGQHAANGGLRSGLTLVGEHGPELADFANPARIYTADQTRAALSGAGETNVSVQVVNNTGVQARVSQKTTYDSETQTTAVTLIMDAVERNVAGARDFFSGLSPVG